jgi:hypothetical protein
MYIKDPDNSTTGPEPEVALPAELASALRKCVEAGRARAPGACVPDVMPPVDLARVAEWLGGEHG